MSWGVKASFRDYLLHAADGAITATGGAEVGPNHMPSWPLLTVAGETLTFGGAVRFVAHYGMLDFEIDRPRIERTSNGARLTTAFGDQQTVIAEMTLDRREQGQEGSFYIGENVTLTEAGNVMFGGAYGGGSVMDPLIIALNGAWAT